MSARDDYPPKRYDQAQARQWEMMCDEIDKLRAWKESAGRIIADWDAVWEVAGKPGALGSIKARAVELEIRRLHEEIDGARQVFDERMDRIESWMATHGYGLPQVIA